MSEYIIKTEDMINIDDASIEIREPQPFDKNILDATKYAENLDRYDDFDALKIPLSAYEQKEGMEFGIKYDPEVHINTTNVILDHQASAALDFLKQLRGFGLLADCVGSGKTFEAGVVLSELAYRGKVKSVLFVVPDHVLKDWKKVIEMKFGLGKSALKRVEANAVFTSGFESVPCGNNEVVRRVLSPFIVSVEDFTQWNENAVRNVLFDAIVVDEAHHLCVEAGKDNIGVTANALKILSIMMETKRKANVPYCVLLSATPHSGNLEHMFRLWYFIRCKGGSPSDFDEKEDKDRTENYRKEKSYYINTVCKGAPTVAEYIQVAKQQILEGTPELRSKYWKDYCSFLEKKGLSLDEYDKKTVGEKRRLRDAYLNLTQNGETKRSILGAVANSYHNGVMRSIMIRQPNRHSLKKRNVINYYFCPLADAGAEDVLGTGSDNFGNVSAGACFNDELRRLNLDALFGRKQLEKVFNDGRLFSKADSAKYFKVQINSVASVASQKAGKSTQDLSGNSEVVFKFLPEYKGAQDVFRAKKYEFVRLAQRFPNDRVIVFFDYDTDKGGDESTWTELYNSVRESNPEIADRIIMAASDENKSHTAEQFEKTANGILFVCDSAFTEGANFQFCSILLNFEVTCDPLAMDQRIGRVFRLGQTKDVQIFSFAAMNALEGYCLAYFDRIGLLSNANGDATIIAGSNNEHMKAIRCPACGRVELVSESDYAERKANGKLRCISSKKCLLNDSRGTEMVEINVYDFKCDKCGSQLMRGSGDKGYQCFASSNTGRGKLTNEVFFDGVNQIESRVYSCSKICAIKHCKRFENNSVLKKNCKVYNAINPEYSQCVVWCAQCKFKDECPEMCRVHGGDRDVAGEIKDCSSCQYANCTPKPHSIVFDEGWTAKCPSCRDGYLRPQLAHTFAAYIHAAYDFDDGGKSFCENLLAEADKTVEIKNILKNDN